MNYNKSADAIELAKLANEKLAELLMITH